MAISEESPLVFGILTRNRPRSLARCINSILATAFVPLRILIAFDDDFIGFQSCQTTNFIAKLLLHPRHYYVRGINRLYQQMKEFVPNLDYFIIVNDDVEFVLYAWVESLLHFYNTSFTEDRPGILELVEHGKCGNYLSRRALFDKEFDGQLANPIYTCYCSDTELLSILNHDSEKRVITAKAQVGTLAKHRAIDDHTSKEGYFWYNQDLKEYNKRAIEHGWNLLKEEK